MSVYVCVCSLCGGGERRERLLCTCLFVSSMYADCVSDKMVDARPLGVLCCCCCLLVSEEGDSRCVFVCSLVCLFAVFVFYSIEFALVSHNASA